MRRCEGALACCRFKGSHTFERIQDKLNHIYKVSSHYIKIKCILFILISYLIKFYKNYNARLKTGKL